MQDEGKKKKAINDENEKKIKGDSLVVGKLCPRVYFNIFLARIEKKTTLNLAAQLCHCA